MKQHLAGGYGDIVKCPNTTREIAKHYKQDDEAKPGHDDLQVIGSSQCHPRVPHVLCLDHGDTWFQNLATAQQQKWNANGPTRMRVLRPNKSSQVT